MKSFARRRAISGVLASMVAITASLAIVGQASAAITASTITNPADQFVGVRDADTGIGELTISGTTTGSGNVDIRCYNGTNSNLVKGNLTVTAQAFSTTDQYLNLTYGRTCVLRAVPTGTNPPDLTPFTGPRISTAHKQTIQSNGHVTNYYFTSAQLAGSFTYLGAGAAPCGGSSSIYAPNYQEIHAFSCAQAIGVSNSDGTGSGLKVNGLNAYLPGSVEPLSASTGFPALTRTPSLNLTNGDLSITESDAAITCPASAFPPDPGNCASMNATGLRLDRTITQDHNGLSTHISDKWVNTTGTAMTISVVYNEGFCLTSGPCSATSGVYTFGDKPPVTGIANGSPMVAPPFTSPLTIYASKSGAADGDLDSARVALTVSPAPDAAIGSAPAGRAFTLQFNNRTVPANGSYTLDSYVSQAFDQATLEGLVSESLAGPDIPDTPGTPGTPGTPSTPDPSAPELAKPTFAKVGSASAKLDKKKVVLSSGTGVTCPPSATSCAINATLTTKVKLPKKKGKRQQTKIVKLGATSLTGKPGSTTQVVFTLSKSGTKLLKVNKRLTFASVINASAGAGAEATTSVSFSAKQPKAPKKK